MSPESKGQARIGPGTDLGQTRPFHALQGTLDKGNRAQREQAVVHEESHMLGARAHSLLRSRQRISRPWPHWGQVVRSLPVRASSISCQVLDALGVSSSGLLGSLGAGGFWRLMRARAFSSLVLALRGAMRP
jgi:hypothetical protein